MRTICKNSAICLLLIASASSAFSTQPQEGTIVVRGTRVDPAEARERAVEFIKRAGVAKGQKQVARWVVPVCIKVIGVEDGQASRIEQSMLEIGAAAKIDVAGPGCEPNITVSFTADPRQVVGERGFTVRQAVGLGEAIEPGPAERIRRHLDEERAVRPAVLVTVRDKGEKCYQVRAGFVLDASGFGRVLPRLLKLEIPSQFPTRTPTPRSRTGPASAGS